MRDPENYRELTEYLDVTQFSDYLILAWYGRLDDWAPDRNWYAGHRTQPPEPALFFHVGHRGTAGTRVLSPRR